MTFDEKISKATYQTILTIIYIVSIAAYIWLVAYTLHLWPLTCEWHWWYIPQVGSLLLTGCIGLYIGFSTVFGS